MGNGITSEIDDLRSSNLYKYIGGLAKYPASAWSKVIKRKLLLEEKLYFKKGLLCEDLEWSARLFSKIESAAFCEHPYYFYRQSRPNSISNSKSAKKVFHQMYSFEKICKMGDNEKNAPKKKMLYSFAEYILRTIVLDYSILTYKQKKKIHAIIKDHFTVIGTRRDIKSRLIGLCIKVFVLNLTSSIFKRFLGFRKKILSSGH